jgi:hypothetical protein
LLLLLGLSQDVIDMDVAEGIRLSCDALMVVAGVTIQGSAVDEFDWDTSLVRGLDVVIQAMSGIGEQ